MPEIKKQLPPKKAIRSKIQTSKFDVESLFQDIGDTEFIRIMLYGRSSTGKTTIWGDFPKPICAIVCSSIDNPGETKSINTPENKGKIKEVKLKTSDNFPILVDFQKTTGRFKTIVLDHASGLYDLLLQETLGLDEPLLQKTWKSANKDEYAECSLKCKEYIRYLLNLDNCNIVIIGQERINKDETDSSEIMAPTVGIHLPPSVAKWVNPAVDYIGQTFIRPKISVSKTKINGKVKVIKKRVEGQYEYCLRVGPHDLYTTKFRKPKGYELPEVIVDPDFEKILSVINNTYSENKVK